MGIFGETPVNSFLRKKNDEACAMSAIVIRPEIILFFFKIKVITAQTAGGAVTLRAISISSHRRTQLSHRVQQGTLQVPVKNILS